MNKCDEKECSKYDEEAENNCIKYIDIEVALKEACLRIKKDAVSNFLCSDGLVLVPIDEDIAAAPIANALLSTGRFTTEECSDLAEGILMFINDHDLVVAKKN